MSSESSQIHPSSVIDPTAKIGKNVKIGPFVVIEADTVIGDGCELQAGSFVGRWTSMGENNVLCNHAVIGGEPQDLGHVRSDKTFLKIGSGNTFREGVTVNRATGEGLSTVIGNDNLFMTCAHVAHNCEIGNNCIMTNGSAMGGHVTLNDKAILSANVLVHQHCRVGRGVMSSGGSVCNMHVPPFCLLIGTNTVTGLNRVGMRRSGIESGQRKKIGEAFKIFFRSGLPAAQALKKLREVNDWGPEAGEFVDFIDSALNAEAPFNRGIVKMLPQR